MKQEIVKSKLKCPKCKSTDLMVLESWKNHDIQWEQVNGEFDKNDGILEPGNPYRVEAKCSKCKHAWTVRKAKQINDIIKY